PTIAHPGGAQFAALSPDGKTIVTARADNTVQYWDTATGAAISRKISLPNERAGADDRSNRRRIMTSGYRGRAMGMALLPDSSSMLYGFAEGTLLYGVADGTFEFWDGETGAGLGTLPAECGGIEGAVLSADCSRFLIFSGVGEARLWDLPPRSSSGRPFPYP